MMLARRTTISILDRSNGLLFPDEESNAMKTDQFNAPNEPPTRIVNIGSPLATRAGMYIYNRNMSPPM